MHFFREYYFTAVSWVRSDAVAVIWMNRAQNISLVTECNQPTWICRVVSKKLQIASKLQQILSPLLWQTTSRFIQLKQRRRVCYRRRKPKDSKIRRQLELSPVRQVGHFALHYELPANSLSSYWTGLNLYKTLTVQVTFTQEPFSILFVRTTY